MKHILDIYLHNIFAGKLKQVKTGALSFEYDKKYIQSKAPAISLSMPIQKPFYDGQEVKSYFSGLLPEDIARSRLANYLGISERNPFAMLEIIGGECAGALSLYPEGEKPSNETKNDIEILDNQKLREILDLLKRRPLLAGTDNLRLSLAGAQDKIAVGVKEGKIALITGSTPTTHILKPLIEDVTDSVHNEFFCMHLAQMMNIDTPKTEIYWLDDTPYFLIERYDRKHLEDHSVKRLHQEDFCQALSVMPEFKYEREGGPNIIQCLDLLQKHSINPAADRSAFINRIIFNYLIGNADAHSKNFSLLYKENVPTLAPAYDLLSTTIYPGISSKMAMKIGNKYDADYVFLRHWYSILPNTAAARRALENNLRDMSKSILQKAKALKAVLTSQKIGSPIFDNICDMIKRRVEHIQIELS